MSAAYTVAKEQVVLDNQIKDLVREMADSCELTKKYAPRDGGDRTLNAIVRGILKQVERGGEIIKIYCEKRPSSALYW